MTSPAPDPMAPPPGGVRDLMVRSRVLAVVVLFCIALAGGLSAIAFERFVLLAGPPGPGSFGRGGGPWRERAPFGHGEFAHGFAARGRAGWAHPTRERFGRELGLSREQQARIDSLMERQLRELRAVRERVQPQVDSIVAQTHREIDAILTPEQRVKVRALGPPPGTDAGAGHGPPGPGDGPVMGPGPGTGDQDQPPPAPEGPAPPPPGRR